MCFDVPKVVRSLGCDHGQDEESRNGRDIKIDILEDYIRTPEWFQGSPEYRGVTGTPRGVNGPSWALVEVEGSKGAVGHAPPRPKPNWFRARGPASSFLLSLSYFLLLLLLLGKEG